MKTLFLDRDGVINVENENGYILDQQDFVFMDGVLEAMSIFKKHFDLIVVATNQRCVGKGMITIKDLSAMHLQMQETIAANDGRIDEVFFAPALESGDFDRKPNIGMAQQAKAQFPAIVFEQSVMVGNNLSDMQFGKTMDMQTVFLSTTSAPYTLPHTLIDKQYARLLDYALDLDSVM